MEPYNGFGRSNAGRTLAKKGSGGGRSGHESVVSRELGWNDGNMHTSAASAGGYGPHAPVPFKPRSAEQPAGPAPGPSYVSAAASLRRRAQAVSTIYTSGAATGVNAQASKASVAGPKHPPPVGGAALNQAQLLAPRGREGPAPWHMGADSGSGRALHERSTVNLSPRHQRGAHGGGAFWGPTELSPERSRVHHAAAVQQTPPERGTRGGTAAAKAAAAARVSPEVGPGAGLLLPSPGASFLCHGPLPPSAAHAATAQARHGCHVAVGEHAAEKGGTGVGRRREPDSPVVQRAGAQGQLPAQPGNSERHAAAASEQLRGVRPRGAAAPGGQPHTAAGRRGRDRRPGSPWRGLRDLGHRAPGQPAEQEGVYHRRRPLRQPWGPGGVVLQRGPRQPPSGLHLPSQGPGERPGHLLTAACPALPAKSLLPTVDGCPALPAKSLLNAACPALPAAVSSAVECLVRAAGRPICPRTPQDHSRQQEAGMARSGSIDSTGALGVVGVGYAAQGLGPSPPSKQSSRVVLQGLAWEASEVTEDTTAHAVTSSTQSRFAPRATSLERREEKEAEAVPEEDVQEPAPSQPVTGAEVGEDIHEEPEVQSAPPPPLLPPHVEESAAQVVAEEETAQQSHQPQEVVVMQQSHQPQEEETAQQSHQPQEEGEEDEDEPEPLAAEESWIASVDSGRPASQQQQVASAPPPVPAVAHNPPAAHGSRPDAPRGARASDDGIRPGEAPSPARPARGSLLGDSDTAPAPRSLVRELDLEPDLPPDGGDSTSPAELPRFDSGAADDVGRAVPAPPPGLESDGELQRLHSKYEVFNVVGEGAYGLVMRCRERATGRDVAIKEFKVDDKDPDAEDVKRTARREVRLLKELKNPNVVEYLEDFNVGGRRVANTGPASAVFFPRLRMEANPALPLSRSEQDIYRHGVCPEERARAARE